MMFYAKQIALPGGTQQSCVQSDLILRRNPSESLFAGGCGHSILTIFCRPWRTANHSASANAMNVLTACEANASSKYLNQPTMQFKVQHLARTTQKYQVYCANQIELNQSHS
jgi:hypothetical protein